MGYVSLLSVISQEGCKCQGGRTYGSKTWASLGDRGEDTVPGIRTNEFNCNQSSNFGSSGEQCYNRAAYPIVWKVPTQGQGLPPWEKTACEEPVIRSLIRPAAIVLLVAAATLPVAADKAKSLYNQGKDAEARQNYEQAYDFYRQAYDLRPKDLQYRASFERLRFLAGASHVHRGQLLREAGKLDEALVEFQKATEIDPSSAIALQETRRTKAMMDAVNSPGPPSSVKSPNPLQRRLEQAGGPVELAAISNVPITLK